MRGNLTFALLLSCFFLSGFAALLYETAWSREFAFVFGTSELAVVAVLAAYMAGLAAGAAAAARFAPRVRRPVLVYGVLEGAIALWALGVPHAIQGLRGLYLSWLGGLEALPETLGMATHAFHLLGAFAVLVPCTALMGATLPLLARFAVHSDEQIGPRVGLLYAVNTAGAIAGTLSAGFLLLPALGLRQTVWVGAGVNAVVFAAAALLSRQAGGMAAERAETRSAFGWILPAIAVSGAVSFGYEVLWFRMLGQLLGTSTAAFSTMLGSFLAGIALGSAVASRWARDRAGAARGFALAQCGAALAACAAFAATDFAPDLATALGADRVSLGPGALIGTGLLLPLTLCIGATFPFAVRLLAGGAEEASAASARVYAWNTVGSIVGAVGTGYVLLPALGLVGTLLAGVACNLALAAFAAGWPRPRRLAFASVAAALALALAATTAQRPDRLLRRSPLGGSYDGEFRFFAVGRSATVALIDTGASWRLTTNGLPESVVYPPGYLPRIYTARWLSQLPVLLRPELESMLIIGLGGGATLAAVPSSVKRIEVIELEPEVVTANREVAERAGGDPLADPRLALRMGDARGALILSKQRFGAIVSQPSHPWTAGASHLYTREFFELVRSRLEPDGVFVQWIGDAFIDADGLRSLLAALHEAFSHVQLYRPPDSATVMLASGAPFDLVASAPRALAATPLDFADAGLQRVEDLAPALALDEAATVAFAGDAVPNTDDDNRLASHWERDDSLLQQPGVFRSYDSIERLAPSLEPAALTRRLHELKQPGRARRVALALPPAERALALGWLALDAGAGQAAVDRLRRAVELAPDSEAARIGLALADRRTPLDGLSGRARAVVEASRRVPDWEAVSELDARLALWRPGELLFREAAQLRVVWRLERGEREGLAEAVRDFELLLQRDHQPLLILEHARAMRLLGESGRAWLDLDSLTSRSRGIAAPAVAHAALRLARALPEPADARVRDQVMQRLNAALRRAPPATAPASSS